MTYILTSISQINKQFPKYIQIQSIDANSYTNKHKNHLPFNKHFNYNSQIPRNTNRTNNHFDHTHQSTNNFINKVQSHRAKTNLVTIKHPITFKNKQLFQLHLPINKQFHKQINGNN